MTLITSASALCFQEGLWGSLVGLTRNQSKWIVDAAVNSFGPAHSHSLFSLMKVLLYPFLRMANTAFCETKKHKSSRTNQTRTYNNSNEQTSCGNVMDS